MTNSIFSFDPLALPLCGDPDRAAAGMERWQKIAHEDERISDRAGDVLQSPLGYALLESIFGNSPFLGQTLLGSIEFTCELLEQGPDVTIVRLTKELRRELEGEKRTAHLMTILRRGKRRVALTTAVADLTGEWSLSKVTAALSEYAEFALSVATAHVLECAALAGEISLDDPTNPECESGYIVLAMGKLGARELNYSSDIDLVVLYDPEIACAAKPELLSDIFVRATRQLVRIMDERTEDGYVFRTDLRLRPDPAATPIAISTHAAEAYYESVGQNWERAAFIKARPIAGDRAAGEEFLKYLRPFIWRKHLDFAAIEDIHSIKRQITAHRGGGKAAVGRSNLAGRNLKLGRGGIREIEFFAQTQQLIWGGRIPALRDRETCKTLSQLANFDQISQETVENMIAAYEYLRRMEHRLQMIDDNQTHTLPKGDTAFSAFAAFMGYESADGMRNDLLHHLRRVERDYERLFETAPDLGGPGSLVFTGSDPDPDTVTTLEDMGFADGASISFAVRGWHHGRYRAMRSVRARELLTELMPRLLAALARTTNPDAAFAKFDEFLAGLPTGVQLFSLFYANPALLDLVAEIMGSAPRLASRLSHQPILLDSVLSSDFFEPLDADGDLAADLERMLDQATDFQDVLDFTRRWVSGHEFQIGVQLLRHRCSHEDAGRAMAGLADTALAALKLHVEYEFEKRHGKLPGGDLAVIAFGKLGGQELTADSDLDLVFVYEHDAGAETSDGTAPLSPGAYYARLSQRLIAAITSLTPEGRLYDVDMRLRPSGAAGPIATPIEGFARYIQESAWTWEHMALTRARVIATPEALKVRLEQTIRSALTQERDMDGLVVDIADMRQRVAKEHAAPSPWEIKHRRGGLLDLEFIVQYLQLRYVSADACVISARTHDALSKLVKSGYLDKQTGDELLSALKLWQRLQSMLRLTLAENPNVESAPGGLRRVLTRTAKVRSFVGLKRAMDDAARRVMTHFEHLIDDPAAEARNRIEN
jgi:[glutamine synthetase] adenylyltransferase / [glutamine synthetase]-adenylyl-L-tyrosine phosphorylase